MSKLYIFRSRPGICSSLIHSTVSIDSVRGNTQADVDRRRRHVPNVLLWCLVCLIWYCDHLIEDESRFHLFSCFYEFRIFDLVCFFFLMVLFIIRSVNRGSYMSGHLIYETSLDNFGVFCETWRAKYRNCLTSLINFILNDHECKILFITRPFR